VPAKDRPNFIANRIGTFGALFTIKTMLEDGYSIEEVDKMTGPAVGRPKSQRSAPLIWSDWTSSLTSSRTFTKLCRKTKSARCSSSGSARTMVQRGLLGNKTKAGFYKKQKGEGDKREIWALDTATLDYRPSKRSNFLRSTWRRTSKTCPSASRH
jgi:3-hydroxyacyl-CoA dehydrogenase